MQNLNNTKEKSVDFVLSGGGPKGAGHAGFLKAIRQTRIRLGTGTGISIGSVVLALHANGYQPDQIFEILQLQFDLLKDCSSNNKSCLRWPSLLEFLNGELLDMLPVFKELCSKYKLKPQANMQIVAYDILHQRAKVFSGTEYDLPSALASSCALPGIMRPIVDGDVPTVSSWKELLAAYEKLRKTGNTNDGIYFDGFLHHPFAFDFSTKPVLISKLGMGTELPKRRIQQLSAQDLAFHVCELLLAKTAIVSYPTPDPKEALLIETGLPSVASVAWDLPHSVHNELFKFGYKSTLKSIRAARKSKWLGDEYVIS